MYLYLWGSEIYFDQSHALLACDTRILLQRFTMSTDNNHMCCDVHSLTIVNANQFFLCRAHNVNNHLKNTKKSSLRQTFFWKILQGIFVPMSNKCCNFLCRNYRILGPYFQMHNCTISKQKLVFKNPTFFMFPRVFKFF